MAIPKLADFATYVKPKKGKFLFKKKRPIKKMKPMAGMPEMKMEIEKE